MYRETEYNILGVRIFSRPMETVLEDIEKRVAKKKKFLIVTPNPEAIVLAQKDHKFRDILNNAAVSIADGIGLKLAEKRLIVIKGRELFLEIIKLADKNRWKVVLLGDQKGSAQKAADKLRSLFPQIPLTSLTGPNFSIPFNPSSSPSNPSLVRKINSVNPQFLFAGFGMPVQEKWLFEWLPELYVNGTMAVGGTFDYLSGKQKLPPKFIENTGLEWLWRLLAGTQDIRRIYNAVVVFPWLVFKEKMSRVLKV